MTQARYQREKSISLKCPFLDATEIEREEYGMRADGPGHRWPPDWVGGRGCTEPRQGATRTALKAEQERESMMGTEAGVRRPQRCFTDRQRNLEGKNNVIGTKMIKFRFKNSSGRGGRAGMEPGKPKLLKPVDKIRCCACAQIHTGITSTSSPLTSQQFALEK